MSFQSIIEFLYVNPPSNRITILKEKNKPKVQKRIQIFERVITSNGNDSGEPLEFIS